MVVFFRSNHKSVSKQASDEVTTTVAPKAGSPKTIQPAAPLAITANTSLGKPEVLNPVVPKMFGQELQALGSCLQIHNSAGGEVEPTIANLNASIRSELGDMIAQADDWTNTHVILPNGEKRRIRIEIDSNGEESVVRRLKYFGVDKEDLPIPISLTPEQSVNPSDAFVASLERDGQVTMREKGVHGVYSQGSQIYFAERNGVLTDIELSRNGRTFKCMDLSKEASRCRCY